ncbi:hypothetical protein [Marinifilum flexuosum]|uniref:hypothetical protein n=1 Tax=Marinifilum flexuosum TaxID=1117708 RepID=UPI00249030A0|nr:hypothetical protein [Marinifilum flexuosum]
MTNEEAFEVAKTVYTQFYAYVKEVIEEFGMEPALKLLTKTNVASGLELGKQIKEQSGGEKFMVQNTARKVIEIAKGIGGIDVIVEDTPEKVVTNTACDKCPNYAAAHAAGMDNETIKAMCLAGSLQFFDTLVKQLNPDLSYQSKKFRSGTDDFCLEQTVLTTIQN